MSLSIPVVDWEAAPSTLPSDRPSVPFAPAVDLVAHLSALESQVAAMEEDQTALCNLLADKTGQVARLEQTVTRLEDQVERLKDIIRAQAIGDYRGLAQQPARHDGRYTQQQGGRR